jgi:hypothetical protein
MSQLLAAVLSLLCLASCTAKAQPAVEWSQSYHVWTPPSDWSKFDYVSLDLENVSSEPFELYIEVRDPKSNDYWNRANLIFTLGPGRQKLNFPTRLYAGESLRPGRPLDVYSIKSVTLARGDNQEGRLVRFYGGELKTGLKASERGIHAFDFGPRGSAVMPGFVGADSYAVYDAEKKYGWVKAKFWTPYERACWVNGPDSLTEDCLMPYEGSFRVDVADGDYEVAVAYDHPGPFWGEFATWERRRVLIGGKAVVDEQDDARSSFKRYFKNETSLPLDAKELADAFGPGRVAIRSFPARAKGGFIDISFANNSCPDRPCFGLAVSTIIVAPKGKMQPFLDELDAVRKTEFAQRSRWAEDGVRRVQLPAQRETLAASLGDYDHRFWDFSPTGDEKELRLEIESADATLKKSLSAGWLQPRVRRRDPQASSVGLSEDLVVFDAPIRARKGQTLRALVKWAPEALAAGSSHQAKLLVKSGTETLASFPIKARVRKQALEPVPFGIGPFGDRVLERWWPGVEDSPRLQALADEGFRLMRQSGLTSYTFEPLVARAGKAWDFSNINVTMKDAKSRGFVELVGYTHFLRDEDACRSTMKAAEWGDLFKRLESESVRNGWLPLTIVLCDEPEGEETARVTRMIAQLPKIPPTARVRWSVTTHIDAASTNSSHRALVNAMTLPTLADFEIERLPKNWIFYNNLSRWNFGFRSWTLHKHHGMKGRLAWTWNQNSADPFNPLDTREDDYRWCTSLSSGKLACTGAFYEDVVEGTRDLRRALTLARLASTPKSPAAERAGKLLEQVKDNAGQKSLSAGQIADWAERSEELLSESGF